MATLSFNIKDVARLVADLETYDSYSPSTDELFDPSMHKDGVVRDTKGRTEAEVEALGSDEFFWPDQARLDMTKIKPCLRLVGDEGVYLMGNGFNKDRNKDDKHIIVYAKGIDPEKDEYWYEEKLHKFGGDDAVISLPVSWYHDAVKHGKRVFSINMGARSIKLNL